MSAYSKRTDDEKRALLAEWRSSGLSRTGFCKLRSISWKTLGEWATRFEGPVAADQTRFVDVEIVPDPRASPLLLELAGSGHRIQVPSDFDAVSLRRLVGALC